MLLGKEAESEAIVGGKPGIRVSLQEYPTGLVPQGAKGRCPCLPDIIQAEMLTIESSVLTHLPPLRIISKLKGDER